MTTKDLPQHIKYWLYEARHDCFFVVGPECGTTERIGAIKSILVGYSEPLRAMLQDSQLATQDDVRLIDLEAETFLNFLKCVYGASDIVIPQLSFEKAVKLLYIADKYLVDFFKAKTLAQVQLKWSNAKIFFALSHPLCFSDLLQKKMETCLQYGFLEMSENKKFLNLSVGGIEWILLQEKINVKEVDIWNLILQWARYQSNSDDASAIRVMIFPLLKYIRFLAMDFKEFHTNVLITGILLKDEIEELARSFDMRNILSIAHFSSNREPRYSTVAESENVNTSFWETSNCVMIVCTINTCDLIPNLQVSSKTVAMAEFFWRLMIVKTNRVMDDDFGPGSLSVFIVCSNLERGWPRVVEHTCKAHINISLMNQNGLADESKNVSHTFSIVEEDWGWRFYMPWDKLMNPLNGFVKENKIVVSARIHLNDVQDD